MSQKTETAKRPVSRKDMTKWQWTVKEMKNNKTGYFLLAPFYIIFFIFTVLPVILSIFFSITDFNMLETPNIIWFDNYIRLFLDDDIFILSVKNTYNQPLIYNNDEIKTSKTVEQDVHGVGIKNIIRIVEKYEGEYVIQNSEREFYFSLIIPIKK